MSFLELAKKRYSCRKYDSRKVEPEKLGLVLEAGRVAPSAVNFQPWHFFVLTEARDLEVFYEAYHREWFNTAPAVIVICGNKKESWKRKADGKDSLDIDVAIATDHMTLQATELGLASCWVCNFDVEKARELLNLPEELDPMVILPLGYPLDKMDPERHAVKRKPLDQIVTYVSGSSFRA